MKSEYINKITDADLILIGVGSEFEEKKYQKFQDAIEALAVLRDVLQKKNFFVISTCTNDILDAAGFSKERTVTPCGTLRKKQCPNQCEGSLAPLTENEIEEYLFLSEIAECPDLGKCNHCGEKLVYNNIYASQYDERGYLDDWKMYTKWLQGTLNKKLCILELGVDFSFPSIIRWPFEKVAFYNQKAEFLRVNENLYHMSEELKDKGVAIPQKAIDWLLEKDI